VKITAARFVAAAATLARVPAPGPPEIAVAGRSNVGKSSLLNALVGRRALARTSGTPGRTRQLNFFLVNERFLLVDLPGYGFAVGPEAERMAWGPLVEGYLGQRSVLRGVAVIVDVRRGVEEDEEQLLGYLARLGVPAVLVATKLDKLGRAEQGRALDRLAAAAGAIPVVGFSARTGAGRDQLWRVFTAWLGPPQRAGAGRGR
jgi:GTP-binding protein